MNLLSNQNQNKTKNIQIFNTVSIFLYLYYDYNSWYSLQVKAESFKSLND